MMLRWERLHPMNAVQFVRLARSVSPDHVRRTARRIIGELCADALPRGESQTDQLCRETPSEPEFRVYQLGFEGNSRLEQILADELNRPYLEEECPFRIGLAEANDGTQYLLFGYRHVIADARSTSLVVHRLLRALRDDDCEMPPPLLHRPHRLQDMINQQIEPQRFLRTQSESARQLLDAVGTYLPSPRSSDHTIAFAMHGPHLLLEDIRRTAGAYSATIQDLLFASIIDWLRTRAASIDGPHIRIKPAVSTIVDLTQFPGGLQLAKNLRAVSDGLRDSDLCRCGDDVCPDRPGGRPSDAGPQNEPVLPRP